jgi:two-component system sensor histidine kinase/response regulator
MNESEHGSLKGKSIDVEALSANIGIDVETYLMILVQFHERSVEDMDLIEAAVQEGKSDGAAREAHSIKGAAANLGIQDVSELARDIEQKARNNAPEEISPLLARLRDELKTIKDMLP